MKRVANMKHTSNYVNLYQDSESITAILWVERPVLRIYVTVCYQQRSSNYNSRSGSKGEGELDKWATGSIKPHKCENTGTVVEAKDALINFCIQSDSTATQTRTTITIRGSISDENTGKEELATVVIPEIIDAEMLQYDVSAENIVLICQKTRSCLRDSIEVGLAGEPLQVLPLLTQASLGDCINKVTSQDKWLTGNSTRNKRSDTQDKAKHTGVSDQIETDIEWTASAMMESRTKNVIISFTPTNVTPSIDSLAADMNVGLKIE